MVNLMDSRGTPGRWRAEPHKEMAWVGLTQGGPAQGEMVIALTTFFQGGEPPRGCDRQNLRVELTTGRARADVDRKTLIGRWGGALAKS